MTLALSDFDLLDELDLLSKIHWDPSMQKRKVFIHFTLRQYGFHSKQVEIVLAEGCTVKSKLNKFEVYFTQNEISLILFLF